MTIRKGEDWGVRGPLPAGVVTVSGNRDLFDLVNRPHPWPPVHLRGGDLARTLGARPTRPSPQAEPGADRPEEVLVAPVDVVLVEHDSGAHRCAAHAVARRSWWRGPIVAVANAQFLGRWDIASRGHPNDGWLESTEVAEAMAVRQRWLAWRRLPTARHLPHPDLATRRIRTAEWTFTRPLDLYLDGVGVGRTRSLRVTVEPDALTVCV